jgi:hypothetical protein
LELCLIRWGYLALLAGVSNGTLIDVCVFGQDISSATEVALQVRSWTT